MHLYTKSLNWPLMTLDLCIECLCGCIVLLLPNKPYGYIVYMMRQTSSPVKQERVFIYIRSPALLFSYSFLWGCTECSPIKRNARNQPVYFTCSILFTHKNQEQNAKPIIISVSAFFSLIWFFVNLSQPSRNRIRMMEHLGWYRWHRCVYTI